MHYKINMQYSADLFFCNYRYFNLRKDDYWLIFSMAVTHNVCYYVVDKAPTPFGHVDTIWTVYCHWLPSYDPLLQFVSVDFKILLMFKFHILLWQISAKFYQDYILYNVIVEFEVCTTNDFNGTAENLWTGNYVIKSGASFQFGQSPRRIEPGLHHILCNNFEEIRSMHLRYSHRYTYRQTHTHLEASVK